MLPCQVLVGVAGSVVDRLEAQPRRIDLRYKRLCAPHCRRKFTMTNRLSSGARIETRRLHTIEGREVRIPAEAGITHLQFRRFAGCPVCNLHLRSFVRRRAELEQAEIKEVILFHSPDDALREHSGGLGLDIVGDPAKILYRAFGVEAGKRALADVRAWPTIARAVAASLGDILFNGASIPPVNPQGGRYGLPADFLIDPSGLVLASHYGQHADDQWSVDEVLALAHRYGSEAAEPAAERVGA
jgi:peroxiredoxin